MPQAKAVELLELLRVPSCSLFWQFVSPWPFTQQKVFAAKQVRFAPLPIVIDSSGVFRIRSQYVLRTYVPRSVTIVSLGRAYSFPRLVLPTGDVGAVRMELEFEFEP